MKETKKVIIIEDDRDISQLIAYNLRKNGFLVEQVFDGVQAHNKLKSEHFDIAILDIMLPGMDGFDICKEIKGSNISWKTFVIIVSAKNKPQDKLYAHILGADCYFAKPFSVASLMDFIKEVDAMQNKEYAVKVK
jgi:DNA-binding response OmpR family regulator